MRVEILRTLALSGASIIFYLQTPIAERESLYVSPSGNSGATGSISSPYALEAGLMAARSSGIDRIVLRGGIYHLQAPLVLSERQSLAAYPGESPVLSGGVKITGWQPHSAGIVKAPRTHNYRQLYINDQKVPLSRSDYYKIEHWWDVPGIAPDEIARATGRVIAVKLSDYQAAGSPAAGALMVIQRSWADNFLPIQSVSITGTKVFLTFNSAVTTAAFGSTFPYKYPGQTYHFENLPNLQEGTWYYDDNWTYYKLQSGESIATIQAIAPKLTTLIEIPSDDSELQGITLKHSLWWFDNGKLTFQGYSQIYVDGRDPSQSSMIKITGKRARVAGCNFSMVGGHALLLGEGSSSSIVEKNKFNLIAGCAIVLISTLVDLVDGVYTAVSFAPYVPQERKCQKHLVRNNIISNYAIESLGSVAIFAGCTNDCKIYHNEIGSGPYSGISIGWFWSEIETDHKRTEIKGNKISSPLKILTDGGAIYALGACLGARIDNNFIDGLAKSIYSGNSLAAGIYLDAGSAGYRGTGNYYRGLDTSTNSLSSLVTAFFSNGLPSGQNLIDPPETLDTRIGRGGSDDAGVDQDIRAFL